MPDEKVLQKIDECVEHAARKRNLSQTERQDLAFTMLQNYMICGEFYYDRNTGRVIDPEDIQVIGRNNV